MSSFFADPPLLRIRKKCCLICALGLIGVFSMLQHSLEKGFNCLGLLLFFSSSFFWSFILNQRLPRARIIFAVFAPLRVLYGTQKTTTTIKNNNNKASTSGSSKLKCNSLLPYLYDSIYTYRSVGKRLRTLLSRHRVNLRASAEERKHTTRAPCAYC